uniref:Chroparavirus methyltransferase domain-containing protein n=1 Tax=Xiangshan insect virus TaxID=2886242 RepID=A0A8K1YQL9_9VIRU|nr:MAG: hypothetical protein [Xiangshan insect virus]
MLLMKDLYYEDPRFFMSRGVATRWLIGAMFRPKPALPSLITGNGLFLFTPTESTIRSIANQQLIQGFVNSKFSDNLGLIGTMAENVQQQLTLSTKLLEHLTLVTQEHTRLLKLRGWGEWIAERTWTGITIAFQYTREFVGNWLKFFLLSGTGILITGTFIYWYIVTRGTRVVRVLNDNIAFNINELKDHFNDTFNGYDNDVDHGVGHRGIARERRDFERACIEYFIDMGVRFRDVGGSRTRGVGIFDDFKHLCVPQIDSADILRDAKSPYISFNHCRSLGSACAYKEEFPGALLIHTDYYMNQEELASIITSHTFIVTHKFEGEGGRILEMEWRKHGPYIHATTPAGTNYRHPFNMWRDEGCIIGSNSASIYVTIYQNEHTRIIYAYPATGRYAVDDPLRLRRSTEFNAEKLLDGCIACSDLHNTFVYDEHDQLVAQIPNSELTHAIVKFGGAIRNRDYNGALASFFFARAANNEAPLHDKIRVQELLIRRCENYAMRELRIFQNDYDPYSMGIFSWTWFYICRWTKYYLGYFGCLLPTSFVKRLPVIMAPWAFSTNYITPYVRHVPNGDVIITNPRPRPFRNPRANNAPAPAEQENLHPGGLHGELNRQHQPEGVGAPAQPAPGILGAVRAAIGLGDQQPRPVQPNNNIGNMQGIEVAGNDEEPEPERRPIDIIEQVWAYDRGNERVFLEADENGHISRIATTAFGHHDIINYEELALSAADLQAYAAHLLRAFQRPHRQSVQNVLHRIQRERNVPPRQPIEGHDNDVHAPRRHELDQQNNRAQAIRQMGARLQRRAAAHANARPRRI